MKNFQICFAILLVIAASSFKVFTATTDNLTETKDTDGVEMQDDEALSADEAYKNAILNVDESDIIASFCCYLPYAKAAEAATGIPATAIMAQAALESGWGERAVGNMFFGIKDNDKGQTGKGQLLKTVEYFNRPDQQGLFPKVYSVTWNKKRKMWKYVVLDWFKKYDSPAESFKDHAQLIAQNERYAKAMEQVDDPVRFVQEIAKAGYATAPDYARMMVKIVRMIEAERAKQVGS